MLSRERLKKYKENVKYFQKVKGLSDTVTDTVKGSSTEPPYTPRTVTISGVDRKRRTRLEVLEGKCAAVEAEIMLTPESVREILWLRHVEGLQWDQVGLRVGEHPDACRMRAKRFLEKPGR